MLDGRSPQSPPGGVSSNPTSDSSLFVNIPIMEGAGHFVKCAGLSAINVLSEFHLFVFVLLIVGFLIFIRVPEN